MIPTDQYTPSYKGDYAAGLNVSHDAATKFSAVFCAMRTRAENIASLPKSVVKQTAGKKEILYSHPVNFLLTRKPNSLMNVFTFWEFMSYYVDGWGNAYAIIERDGHGDPVNLFPVESYLVGVTKVKRELWYKVYSGDYKGTYAAYDILHFKLFTKDGIKGIDPISNMSESIGLGLAAQHYNAQFFEKGGHLKGVYQTDQSLGDEQYSKLMEHMSKFKNFDTPLLEYGIKYAPISISPEAAQLIQQRTFSIQDISRIFNIPPHMLAENSHSTFSNIEQQDIQFVKYSIRPSVKRFETEIEDKLLFEGEKDIIDIKFNLDGLLRGDTATRAAYYHSAVQDGWLNRNEVRDRENLNRGPKELDEYLYPSNLNLAEILGLGSKKDKDDKNNKSNNDE